jgi:long-chain acyl-CoA synthetase
MNLTELLDNTASSWPQKPALVEGNTAVSYSELVGKIRALANQLEALGVRPGARIGLCFPNSVNYVALTYALWRLGAVVVPVPVECTEEELTAITTSMELEGILSPQSRSRSVAVQPDYFFLKLNPTPPENHGLNIAFIRFTSGTTSARKGVVLCHETIRDRVLAANKALRIGPDDTVIWCLPMAHHFLITIVLYLSHGATIVLARHVIAQPFLEAVNRWRGTVLYATPFQYGMLARDKSGATLPSVRLAVSTTCALTHDVAEDFRARFGFPLVQALGVIELGLVAINLDDPINRWNSVGRPLADHQLRITSPDENGCGEIAISGPGIFDAYAAPWLSREQILHDGWFSTGDIGRVDKEGFLFLISRKTAVINLAGRKVFPEEIEAVLNRHPAVRESRVYGRVHPHLGEIVEAEIVLTHPEADLDSIRELCRRSLASYKIPSRLHVVSHLPRTAVTGKIRREAAIA